MDYCDYLNNKNERVVAHLDMNAFFASVEQRETPSLQGKPVLIISNPHSTTVITCSYEARKYGIYTGLSIYEARRLCPEAVIVAARLTYYQELSTKIWEKLRIITPDIEIASVDEAFLDLTHHKYMYLSYKAIANAVHRVMKQFCLPYSIGISSSKCIAKYAAGFRKPKGVTFIPPHYVKPWLAPVKLSDFAGVGTKITKKLAKAGFVYCYQVQNCSISRLNLLLGAIGKWLWLLCHGVEYQQVMTTASIVKSMSHAKVLPKETYAQTAWLILQMLCYKLSERLRKIGYRARYFAVGIYTQTYQRYGKKYVITQSMDDGQQLFKMIKSTCTWPENVPIKQVHIVAWELIPSSQNNIHSLNEDQLLNVQDKINQRYGKHTIMPLSTLMVDKSYKK